jgi:hypothetical protein
VGAEDEPVLAAQVRQGADKLPDMEGLLVVKDQRTDPHEVISRDGSGVHGIEGAEIAVTRRLLQPLADAPGDGWCVPGLEKTVDQCFRGISPPAFAGDSCLTGFFETISYKLSNIKYLEE